MQQSKSHKYPLTATDLRDAATTPLNFTKSINLALSERGINALRSSGHEDVLAEIFKSTIPMHGRMIHTKSRSGALKEESQAYDVHGRFQRSVDRNELSKILLDKLETLPNVKIFFQHKLTGADFARKRAWLEDLSSAKAETSSTKGRRANEIEIDFDLLIGSDGAHSNVRYHMMKFARVNYQQEFIDCLWSEFTMEPDMTANKYLDGYRIHPNHLHIWPSGSNMFVALPSPGGKFVCTLFGSVALFSELEKRAADGSGEKFISKVDELFPGVTDHIPGQSLLSQFRSNPHLPLMNVKCSPHHFSSSVVLVGDSANAMVPFYGQGMNAGLESVRVLWDIIDRSKFAQSRQEAGFSEEHHGGVDWHHPEQCLAAALKEYTVSRTPDAHAITDLALGNWHEMSRGVVSTRYKMRKWIEETLDKRLPILGWKTQYARVSFGNERYSSVVAEAQRQSRVLNGFFDALTLGAVGGVAYYVWKYTRLGRQ